jgi:hypothetical protein
MRKNLVKFRVVIRTGFGEPEVEGEKVKELMDGLSEIGFSAEQTEALLKSKSVS